MNHFRVVFMVSLFLLPVLLGGQTEKDALPAKKLETVTNMFGVTFVKIPNRYYYLGVSEITQGQYKKVINMYYDKVALSDPPQTWPWDDLTDFKKGDDYPAHNLTWIQSSRWCYYMTLLQNKFGKTSWRKSFLGYKYRLPTEEEWEYCCRAKTDTRPSEQTKYCFGNRDETLAEYAWYDRNTTAKGEGYPRQVMQKKPSKWGLYDMHGNVAEWCLMGNDSETRTKALRGGGYSYPAWLCTSFARIRVYKALKNYANGFRVIYTLD